MKISKKYLYILLYICILALSAVAVYMLHVRVTTFSEKIHETQMKVASLEENQKVLDLYKKILIQGSKEQQDIEKYILTSARTFDVVSQIEKDAKDAGLIGKDRGGILSVESRENAEIEKYGAHELVVRMEVENDMDVVDRYVEALTNLPYVSHIEKIQLAFDNKTRTATANIVLVLTESK